LPPGSIYNATGATPFRWWKKQPYFFRWKKKCSTDPGLPNGSAKVTEKPNSYLHGHGDGWLFLKKHQKTPPVGVTNFPNFWKVPPEMEGDFEKV